MTILAAITEASKGGGYRVRVIRSGLSLNGFVYPAALLAMSAAKFDGARVFVKSDAEHIRLGGKDFRNLIGGLSDAAYVETAPGQGEVQATLRLIIDDADPVAVRLREAVAKQMTDLFGLSIDVAGQARSGPNGTRIAQTFDRIHSVDLIVEPGAGGGIISFTEAAKGPVMGRDQLIALIQGARPELLEGKDVTILTDEELAALLTAALKPAEAPPAPAAMTEAAGALTREQLLAALTAAAPAALAGKDVATVADDQLRALLAAAIGTPAAPTNPAATAPAPAANPPAPAAADAAMVEAAIDRRMRLHARVAACALPEAAKARVLTQFAGAATFTEADVTREIATEASYLAGMGIGGGHVAGSGATVGEGPREKGVQMLEAFFDPKHKDHRHAQSIRACYQLLTGDDLVTGRLPRNARMTEALSSISWADVLGDSITRRMIADYNSPSELDIWRPLTGSPVPVNDFRSQERTRWGGYGDLPVVAQSGTYTALASPGDEGASYAIAKRGGTETVTIEMIKNDDVGAIRRIPEKLSRAAKRTLAKFALDFLRTNPVIYDGKALFHVDHNNLLTVALAAASWAAARLAMVRQTEFGTTDAIGVGPKTLYVPPTLEEAAYNIFQRSTNLDKTYVQTLVPDIIPVWYWTDASDWVAAANPADIPTIELGFLDGNEEPELFVQDSPTSGSFFSNDQITYKIRHIYGGAVLDYRGLVKSVVAD